MLFGEYSVICNSMGLTIPYAHFQGELSFINDEKYTEYDFAIESNHHLKRYFAYLSDLDSKKELIANIDLSDFEKDLSSGLYFESSIPQGYGIGSSGALVAAIYNAYSVNGIASKRFLSGEEVVELKKIFAQMESYFHGVSSGLDPLLCYIKYPLLIRSKEKIETVGIPRNKFHDRSAIFLINTGKQGMTGPLVNNFFQRCDEPSFRKKVDEEFIPANDACINALLNGEMTAFFHHLDHLSRFQYENFQLMIPEEFTVAWKKGIDSSAYRLKLCGSGGGGFLLGITQDYERARKSLLELGIHPILVYIS